MAINGRLKSCNEDFRVDEIMPVSPSGEGEHLWLLIEKNGENTDWVAKALARHISVKPMAVSYAGLKDRHAVTTQWFSIHLPGMPDPDLSVFESGQIKILKSVRHDRKLKLGTLSGNQFGIVIRDLTQINESLEERLLKIKKTGVPNYFGEQRFGREMSNLSNAEKLFAGKMKRIKKHQRGLYLSSARSWIFNCVLSERIKQNNWNQYVPGDVFMLDGKSACFPDDQSEDTIDRINNMEIHPTGPLWGDGDSMAKSECLEIENIIAQDHMSLATGLANARMKQERRSLRLKVNNLEWEFVDSNNLHLKFDLVSGTFATMVIREIIS